MRTVLICHEDAALDREGLAQWLASFSTFAGTVVIREPAARRRRRVWREWRRVGLWRLLDVLAFRLFHHVFQRAGDRRWEVRELDRLRARFGESSRAREMIVASANSAESEAFIRAQRPDLVIARCKTLLNERVFTIPRRGTFVMHPGICPDYRNAHGCFWARALGDIENVGMTLLRIDRGIDTGPIYGHFRVDVDAAESHVITQHRAVLEHLDAIRDTLLRIEDGTARAIDTTGRASAVWGQPWLSAYVAMRLRTRTSTASKSAVGRLKSEAAPR